MARKYRRSKTATIRGRRFAGKVKPKTGTTRIKGKPATLTKAESQKIFSSLTMEDKPLLERLAGDYAKIFNTGHSVEHVGLERFYLSEAGGKVYNFEASDEIKLARIPTQNEIKTAQKGNLLSDMKLFYESIDIWDFKARAFFVSCFRNALKKDIKNWFQRAIRHSFSSRSG